MTTSANASIDRGLRAGGWLSAIGALGLVVTNVFYALGLAATPAPTGAYALDAAMSGAVAAAPMLKAAGAVGLLGDLVWATAALSLAQAYGRLGNALAASGWNLLVLAVILFFFVDSMTGFVLPQLALAHNVESFEGFRRFWDVLFLYCVLAFGAATITIAADSWRQWPSFMGRLQAGAMIAIGAVGAITALAGFLAILKGGLPAYAIPGASIGFGAALFVPLSLKIALSRE